MKNSSLSTLAVKKSARPKKKKSSAASRARKRKPDDDVKYVPNPNNVDDGRRITRHEFHMRVMKFQKKNKKKVKQEPKSKLPRVIEGETLCPVCGMKNYSGGGCKTITCTWPHPNGRWVYYCGHCGMLSEEGLLPKCKCSFSFDRWAREQPVEVDEDDDSGEGGEEEEEVNTKISFLESLEYCQSIPGGDKGDTSRASTRSSSVSEKMGRGKDSNATDSDTSTKTASEAVAMASATSDEDDDVQDEVPTAVLSNRTIKIKQKSDVVPSTAFEEDTVRDKIPPQEDMSSTAIPVVVKVKTERAAHHEETDVEDSTSSKEDGGEEECNDVAAPIHQESQLRKRGTATAVEEEEEHKAAPKKRRKVSSSRKGASKKSSKDEQESVPAAKVVIDLSDVPPQAPILKGEGNMKEGTSRYTGVHKQKKKWRAMIKIEGQQRYIGNYENEEEAAIDYARAVFKYKGQGASKGKRKSLEDEEESAPSAKVVIDLSDVPSQLPITKSEGNIKEGASKYAGVYLNKQTEKWQAAITIKGKTRHIGLYETEEEAAIDYARALFKYKGQGALDEARTRKAGASASAPMIDLCDVPQQSPILKSKGNIKEGASKYAGVYFNKKRKKWETRIVIDGKQPHIGYYENEEKAAIDYARAVFKYKGQGALDKAREQNSASVIDLSDAPPQAPIPKRDGSIKEGASRYMGVRFIKGRNKWQAQIMIEGKTRHIGSYEKEEEAAIDFARALFKYKGQGALDRARGRNVSEQKAVPI